MKLYSSELLLDDLNEVAACIVENCDCDVAHCCWLHEKLHAFFH